MSKRSSLFVLGLILPIWLLAQTAFEHFETGLNFIDLEQFEKAHQSFTKAIVLAPENIDFYLARGELLLMENSEIFNKKNEGNREFYEKALEDFEIVLSINPHSFDANYGKARLHYMFLEFANAQTSYDMAVKSSNLIEDKILALGGRGACQFRLGETEGALLDLERALDYDSDNAIILNEFALMQINLGEYEFAKSTIQKILDMRPDDLVALSNLGYAFLKEGDLNSSLEIYDEVLQKRGPQAFLLSNRASCLYGMGKYDEALDEINQSILIQPKNSFAFKNRAQIYIALGEMELACNDLFKAKELGFSLAYGNEVIHLLSKYCLSTNRSPSKN
ncbi:MAG: hypothetical protein HKN16_00940 [Saprospiraceae bacterium]|nr:hypothetical protein [Saprospiraceae bacterium]